MSSGADQFWEDSVAKNLPIEELRRKCYDNGGMGGIYGSTTPCFDADNPHCPHARECFFERGGIRKSKAEGGEKMSEEESKEWVESYQKDVDAFSPLFGAQPEDREVIGREKNG